MKEPRLLCNIIEAIVNLKERNGSTEKQITDHLGEILKKDPNQRRNLAVQIKRAIDHGVKTGLVKRNRGKYSVGLNVSVIKSLRNMPLVEPCSSVKRGRRRRRRRRSGRRRSRRSKRRRGRRHALTENDVSEEAESASEGSLDGADSPSDRASRRRRRRRRRRSRRRRRRGSRRGRRRQLSAENTDSAESVSKSSSDNLNGEKTKQETSQLEFKSAPVSRTESRHNLLCDQHQNNSTEEALECGNPECLCGINAESTQRHTPQDNYHNSYLN
ncbi:ADP-ribosylation factor-like protein 6-interacting protein 4 [Cylas formicarius]|uniref:ADP-ribosylation factor-like protein 6-interacting protein 4 n=1 Tax=Cylas formicarius TaxID=197179 RepID=UPI002958DD89|nr:ADP-ribosylation factor-like protein 6-interacting protein 4 [Cylas formicarius]